MTQYRSFKDKDHDNVPEGYVEHVRHRAKEHFNWANRSDPYPGPYDPVDYTPCDVEVGRTEPAFLTGDPGDENDYQGGEEVSEHWLAAEMDDREWHEESVDPDWVPGQDGYADLMFPEEFNPPSGNALAFPLPTDKEERKNSPMTAGVLDYFKNALFEVAKVSKAGNDQHNPGQPLHWSREKSTDHADCIMRHLAERGDIDNDGQRHSAKLAWRALALLQEELEDEYYSQQGAFA